MSSSLRSEYFTIIGATYYCNIYTRLIGIYTKKIVTTVDI